MKIPKELSEGEETLALHLRANKIPFQREISLIPGRKWRADFLIDPSLVIEIHGGTWKKGAHSSGAGLERDYKKMNAHILAGFSVLQFSTTMVTSGEAIRTIMQVTGCPFAAFPPKGSKK
jgi:hypothetical protein